jgi:hypothetical protein
MRNNIMSTIIFGITSGIVVAAAGTSILDEPLKAIALIVVVNVAHVFTKD